MCHELGVLQDISGDSGDCFYAGELNGELVASVVITPIADDMQYVGYLHIVERLRGSGFARRLMTTARDVERRRNWSGMVCLNTVPDAEPLFEKFCYKTIGKLTRYRGVVSAQVDQELHETDVRQVTN